MAQNIPEIVAPAGSKECFTAALNAGADACYAGVSGFNMRAGADRFEPSDIHKMVSLAHDNGVKLYFALNVLVYDEDFDEIRAALDVCAHTGVDAVILWDMAVLDLAKERGLAVHLSTQASVANSLAIRWYETQGVKRIVLARELSLDQLGKTIAAAKESGSGMKFECFVHGAMCVALSGRCLTSQFLYGRSANRGDCIQPCRRSYRITDEHNGFELAFDSHTVLSARDLCTIDIIDRITDAGIDAFKIEGRMRDPLYVKTTVECYREARDAVLSGSYDQKMAGELKRRLERVFHRGFSTGFYLRPPDDDFAGEEGNVAVVTRQYAGKVGNYYPKAGAADIRLEARHLNRGETVLITGPTTGAVEFTADSLRSEDNQPVMSASAGSLIGLETPEKVREGDRLYVLVLREQTEE
ncbi:MAG: U32 family peptidase [Candidatus Latescibacteria bacterium]|nr:U32 family peptidase [Candidatus Latescibacterota bacterium]